MILTPYSSKHQQETVALFATTFGAAESPKEGKLIAELAENLLSHQPSNEIFAYLAIQEKQIAAAIICSKMFFAESAINSFILGPVAVLPPYQKQGIGTQLIEYAKTDLAAKEVQLLLTYGDPNYYQRVGFTAITTQQIPAPQTLSMPQGWLAQTLDNSSLPSINEKSHCVPALNKPIYW